MHFLCPPIFFFYHSSLPLFHISSQIIFVEFATWIIVPLSIPKIANFNLVCNLHEMFLVNTYHMSNLALLQKSIRVVFHSFIFLLLNTFKVAIACPSLHTTLNRAINVHWTFAHVVVGFVLSYLSNQLTSIFFNEFLKYYNLCASIFSPLVTHTLVNCWKCEVGSSPSRYKGSWILNIFLVGATIARGIGKIVVWTTIMLN